MKKNENINPQNAQNEQKEVTTVELLTANTFADLMEKCTDDVYTGVTREITESGRSFVTKDYELINPIGKRTSVTIMNTTAIKATEKIAFALTANKLMEFAICRELANINNEDILSEMGFKSISEYGNALFDFSRVTCTQYARIGKLFIGDDYKLKYRYIPKSFGKSHLLELLALVGEDDDMSAIETAFIDSKILHDGMSTSAIRKAVKSITAGVIDVEGREIDSEESTPSEVTTERSEGTQRRSRTRNDSEAPDTQISIGKVLNLLTEARLIYEELNEEKNPAVMSAFELIYAHMESLIETPFK